MEETGPRNAPVPFLGLSLKDEITYIIIIIIDLQLYADPKWMRYLMFNSMFISGLAYQY